MLWISFKMVRIKKSANKFLFYEFSNEKSNSKGILGIVGIVQFFHLLYWSVTDHKINYTRMFLVNGVDWAFH